MNDTIEINLRALTEKSRSAIGKALLDSIDLMPDQDNYKAIDTLAKFNEEILGEGE